MMDASSRERAAFVVSLAFLAWMYGFLTGTAGWFPSEHLRMAWLQARNVVGTPSIERSSSTRVYNRVGARVVEPESMAPGLTLVSARWAESDWVSELRLLDPEGRTLHAWRMDPGEILGDPSRIAHGFQLLPRGDVLVNLDYASTVRLDACGNVVWKLPTNGHHSIHRTEGGTFWIPGLERPPAQHAAWEIDSPGPVYQDQLVHISADGRVLEQISVLDVLAADERTFPYLIRHQQGADITHLNDIEPLSRSMASEYPLFAAGDLLISAKHLNLVFVLDPETREVKWHASEPFIQQHDPDFIGNGWIGVFDNREDGTYRGTRLGGSRIVALQPHTDSTRVLFPGAPSDPFHTPNMGTWQTLANGNLLLTESRAGRVVEVAPDGRTVWEWVVPPIDEATVPEVYQSSRYQVTREEVATWPCSQVEATGAGDADRR